MMDRGRGPYQAIIHIMVSDGGPSLAAIMVRDGGLHLCIILVLNGGPYLAIKWFGMEARI